VDERRIVVLGTGGTIAGRADSAQDNLGYRAAEVGVDDLLRGVPRAHGLALVTEQVAQVDSKDMDFPVWLALAGRCAHWLGREDVAGIVITHGTDTMEETAFFLQSVLAPARPVVLTGAMRPATSAAADGPQNLADALLVAAAPGARGVCVAFGGAVHSALDVQKVHGWRVDAFSSGDAGVIAWVEDARLRVLRAWPAGEPLFEPARLPPPAGWPRVEIVMSQPVRARPRSTRWCATASGRAGVAAPATAPSITRWRRRCWRAREQRGGATGVARCVQGRVLPSPGRPAAGGRRAVAGEGAHRADAGADGRGFVKASLRSHRWGSACGALPPALQLMGASPSARSWVATAVRGS